TAPVAQEICCDKNNTNSNSVQEPSGYNNATPPKSEELKESEYKEICCDKNNTNSNSVQEPSGYNNATPPKSEELKESEYK
ncbi:hypothetical protein RYX36_020413, partial [Vicia faba]